MNLVLGARERWLNIALFLLFAAGTLHALREAAVHGNIGWVDLSFAAQNAVFCAMLLSRKPAGAVDGSLLHQGVALAAFFSGLLFLDAPLAGSDFMHHTGQTLVVAANILAVVCLVSLGRSFGILIALREVRTAGIYAGIRHPMYASDLLLRLGYLVAHPSLKLCPLFLLCCGLYSWRALLEERFLSRDPSYAEYMRRVPYRFVPGIF